jgi:putative drug exporter of the RND superfamily
VIGSVTVLAALLAKLGDRVDKGRVPFLGKRKHNAGEARFCRFVLDRVLDIPRRGEAPESSSSRPTTSPPRGSSGRSPS